MIPYGWNKFVNHVNSMIIIISQMGVFFGNDHQYVVNQNFFKNHFQMEDKRYVMWVTSLIIISNVFQLINSKQNLMQSKKKLYYTLYHHYEKKKVFCNQPCNKNFELHKTLATHYIYISSVLMNKLHELQHCNLPYIWYNLLQLNWNSVKTTHFQLLCNPL